MSTGLEIGDLTVPRAGFPIVRGVSLHIPAGEVTVLLGANGAGKTTLLEALSGLIPATSGTVELDGVDIAGFGRVQRALSGLGHVEQGRHVFGELTVAENVEVATGEAGAIDRALAMFPELVPRRDVLAGSLSGGEQQMVVIARALARNPKALLLDEMSLGLAPVIVQRLLPIVRTLADEGVAVLLVEQYANLALGIGNSAYVLNRGAVVLQGTARELAENPDSVRDAYLGTSAVTTGG
ncbi:MAG: transporter ATP-binding protein [Conexibacter sp.]|nr:transporter ATP-binding protein [Conexibacter sp.]